MIIFLMCVPIRGKRVYRIDETTRRTTNETLSEIIIYNDVKYVNQKIKLIFIPVQ